MNFFFASCLADEFIKEQIENTATVFHTKNDTYPHQIKER